MTWSRRPRVFILDDERLVADTLATIFSSRGLDAYAFYDAEEALEQAKRDTPDLLVTDVALGPNVCHGIEVAVRFQRICPDCRVLLISGHASTSELYADASEKGYTFPLLAKPIHPEELLEECVKLLGHLQTVN